MSALLALLAASSLSALAADGEPEKPAIPAHRWYWENMLAARVNPLGFQDTFAVYSRWRLSESQNKFLYDTYAMVGPSLMVTPAFARAGLAAQAMPLTVLRLGVKGEWVGYFGTFEQLLAYEDPTVDWSDTAREAASQAGLNGPTTGFLGTADVRAQVKGGPVLVRYTATFQLSSLNDPNEDPDAIGYYDQVYDIVAPLDGLLVVHDTDLALAPGGKLAAAGVRWTHVNPSFGGGEEDFVHRVGPLVAYRFKDAPGAAFNQPTLLLISQWHLVHPNRTGQDVSQAIPYLALAFASNGDLKKW